MGPGIIAGAISGLVLATVSSAGIVAERLARGDARVVLGADAVAAAVAVIVLATTFRPFITISNDHEGRSPARVIGAQALGALAGVTLVHLALRATSLRTCGWLCEEPRQVVNDLAAAFGALALVWGCARQPVGAFASLGAVAIAALYAITSSRWHLDAWRADVLHGAFRSISVQIAVLAQIACTAVGVAVFHRLRTAPPSLDAC